MFIFRLLFNPSTIFVDKCIDLCRSAQEKERIAISKVNILHPTTDHLHIYYTLSYAFKWPCMQSWGQDAVLLCIWNGVHSVSEGFAFCWEIAGFIHKCLCVTLHWPDRILYVYSQPSKHARIAFYFKIANITHGRKQQLERGQPANHLMNNWLLKLIDFLLVKKCHAFSIWVYFSFEFAYVNKCYIYKVIFILNH